MKSNDTNTPAPLDRPTEIQVPTDWAEEQMAKGKLNLTPEQIGQLAGNATITLPIDLYESANPPSIPERPIEWIEPIDAVHWLSPKVGGDAAAKAAIAERLRDGAIECTQVWQSVGPDIGPVSNQRSNFPIVGTGAVPGPSVSPINRGNGSPVMMGGAFWNYSDDWDADLKRWDWRAGLFVVSRQHTTVFVHDGIPTSQLKSKLRSRMVVSGIRFSKEDIRRIVVSAYPNSGDEVGCVDKAQVIGGAANRGRKGPRPKKFNSARVLARLESEILSGAISRLGRSSDYGVQAALECEITSELTEADGLEPSESTVRRKAAKLMAQWRDHEARGGC